MAYNSNSNNSNFGQDFFFTHATPEEENAIQGIKHILSTITTTLKSNGFTTQAILNLLEQIRTFVGQDRYVENDAEHDEIAVASFPQIIQGSLEELYDYWHDLGGHNLVQYQIDFFTYTYRYYNPIQENVNADPQAVPNTFQDSEGGRRKHKSKSRKLKRKSKKSKKTKRSIK